MVRKATRVRYTLIEDSHAGTREAQVKRVVTPGIIAPKYVDGCVGKKPFTMLLDSGADHSVVHPRVVQPHEWLGRCIQLRGVGGVAQQATSKSVGACR